MPVIIDHVDLLDTRPDRGTPPDGATTAPAPDRAAPGADRTAATLRTLERRAARVLAD